MAPILVAMDDVDITAVDQPPAIVEEDLVPFRVVGAARGEPINGRSVTDAARAEPGARAVLSALVVGHANDGHVGLELTEFVTIGHFENDTIPVNGRIKVGPAAIVLPSVLPPR